MWIALLITTALAHASVTYDYRPALRGGTVRYATKDSEAHFDVAIERAGPGCSLRLKRIKHLFSPGLGGRADLWQVFHEIYLRTSATVEPVNLIRFRWIDPSSGGEREFELDAQDLEILEDPNQRRDVVITSTRQRILSKLLESGGNARRIRGAHVSLIGTHGKDLGEFELTAHEVRHLINHHAPGPAKRLYRRLRDRTGQVP